MKIAYCIRENWKSTLGGDVVQMLQTKAEIEKNYDVEIQVMETYQDLKKFQPDIVHIFNMQTLEESSKYLSEAKELGCITVLSTIYWDLSHARFIVNFAKFGIFCNGEGFRNLYHLYNHSEAFISKIIGKPTSATNKYKNRVKNFLKEFDIFLPNSEEEMQIINKLFNEAYTNYSVIPNSVDFDKFLFSNNSNRNGFISAARIEPIKNQLMLAKIAKENAYNLTLVGGFTQNNVNYVNKVRTICENQSKIDLITQNIDQKTLGNMFQQHKVHILASFRESPGLSSLEAIGSGLNLVVSESDFCPTHTYFDGLIDKHVFICDPYSEKSIHQAMKLAHESQSPEANLIKRFSWHNTAVQTYQAYCSVL
ncbi:glycosyltransferase family 4 protein [Acinetobacter baumannii]|uniref:Gtr155 n=1 Tax=Acinetobacter baumannii TaxID=470 RepID=A0A513QCL9_ACIBA|nr:Gtr155 [Acinetobacter baumannii]